MEAMKRMQGGYFPPAPTNSTPPSFNLIDRFRPQNPDQHQQLVTRLEGMINGQGPAQNIGQGIGQLMSGAALNMAKQNAAFPQAPDGGQPSFMTGLANFFTGGRNGGLY